ncbi:MAG: glutamyl-tRNA reductase [Phycisphaeraceae bacterium]
MRVLFVGINHRTAPLSLRERCAVVGDIQPYLHAIKQRFPASECVVLSTCNRLEVYATRPNQQPPDADDLRAILAELFEVPADQLAAATIHREQDQAIGHLFRVCCGLDSMVIGEPQILGQVKRAYESAVAYGTVGPVLHRVFQQAIAAARQARTATGIDQRPRSVGSIAAGLAQQVFNDLSRRTILAIGAGEIAEDTLQHLLRHKPGRLLVINRTSERALQLAEQLGLTSDLGGARPWEELDHLLKKTDVVVTSASAPEPILTPTRLKPILKRRCYRPLVVIDLGLPRNVDPAVGSMKNLYLHNLDDLQHLTAHGTGPQADVIHACESHLNRAVTACLSQITHANLGQLIRQLRNQLHDLGQEENRRTLRKLTQQADSPAVRQAIEEHTHRLINKILHLPLSQIDHRNPDAPLGFYAAALRRLFDLKDPPSDTSAPNPPDPEPDN